MYNKMFEPLNLGTVELPNRVMMGSMHTGLEEVPDGARQMAAFYEERAKGEVGMIVTGGISPNFAGRGYPHAAELSKPEHLPYHKTLADAIKPYPTHLILQILHTGRYGYHMGIVAPSPLKSRITPFPPRELSNEEVEQTIEDFVNTAKLAEEAGYSGVEVMGSEGYLINQFLSPRTNKRTDQWGGEKENRIRFASEIVKRIKAVVSESFIIIYRLSLLDLVEDGNTWEDTVFFAKEIEKAGATILNTGIGWHEAKKPTIAYMVPHGAFTWATKKMRQEVSLPFITSNRINHPQQIEDVLDGEEADVISMARPFLADAYLVKKAREEREKEINTCIACNQACLDHIFNMKSASCMVNPIAARETLFSIQPAASSKRVAVVGSGPAGLSAAYYLADRGHTVEVFEKNNHLGGQFNLAAQIPGKEDYLETIRYFKTQLEMHNVNIHLNTTLEENDSRLGSFDHVVNATGVLPRIPEIPGIDHPKVVTYEEVISGKEVGENIAIIGAGGVAVDTALYLIHGKGSMSTEEFMDYWGIDTSLQSAGALKEPKEFVASKKVTICHRSNDKPGKNLGKTTGWVNRMELTMNHIDIISGVQYEKIDDQGLHMIVDGAQQVLDVDHIVLCAGQISQKGFAQNDKTSVIGGANDPGELNAVKAIFEGFKFAIEFK